MRRRDHDDWTILVHLAHASRYAECRVCGWQYTNMRPSWLYGTRGCGGRLVQCFPIGVLLVAHSLWMDVAQNPASCGTMVTRCTRRVWLVHHGGSGVFETF